MINIIRRFKIVFSKYKKLIFINQSKYQKQISFYKSLVILVIVIIIYCFIKNLKNYQFISKLKLYNIVIISNLLFKFYQSCYFYFNSINSILIMLYYKIKNTYIVYGLNFEAYRLILSQDFITIKIL